MAAGLRNETVKDNDPIRPANFLISDFHPIDPGCMFICSSLRCIKLDARTNSRHGRQASLGRVPGKFRETVRIRMPSNRQFTFGQVRFDSRTGELWQDGKVAKLTPRAAAVLCALAERAQQLVTKQELFDRVWGGRAVGDDALTSCIQELRGVLNDDARRPRYIETRHRRGYRLLVPAGPAALGGAPASRIEAP